MLTKIVHRDAALGHDIVVSHDFSPEYPIDQRSERRRRHAAEGPVADFEGMAARVLARFTGERVVIQDDGSQAAMPDIRIDYSTRPPAYVEAVVDVDSSYAAMAAKIWKLEPLPADLTWTVHLTSRAPRLSQLRTRLPQILGSLHNAPEPEVIQELDRLGVRVTGPWEPRPGETGKIHLRPEGVFGDRELRWGALLDWIAEFLESDDAEDVRRKLATTGAANGMPSSAFRSLARGMPTTPSAGKDDRGSRPCHQDCLQRSPTCGCGRSPDLAGAWHGFQIRDGSMLWIIGLRHDLLLAKIVDVAA